MIKKENLLYLRQRMDFVNRGRIMGKKERKGYYLFSPWLRTFHWTMVVAIGILFATGLYIGSPGFGGFPGEDPTIQVGNIFSMETFRRYHFYAGFLLVAALVLRVYGACINKGDRLLPKWRSRVFWEGIVISLKHYLFIPQKTHAVYLRNSLARMTYFIVYILLVCEIITGVSMYAMIRPNSFLAGLASPVIQLFGEYGLHMMHHYIAWCFAVFVPIHVYLAFREDYMEKSGEVSSMVTGSKYFAQEPVDKGDIE